MKIPISNTLRTWPCWSAFQVLSISLINNSAVCSLAHAAVHSVHPAHHHLHHHA